MRKPSTRAIVTKPAAVKAAAVTVAKAATAARAVIAKPVTATAIVAPVATVPTVPAVAKPSANITRTAATVVRNATNFASLSTRDSAYLAFYASIAKAAANGNVTLAGIVASGRKPVYVGSDKPHDAGVINRLTKAGLLATNDSGHGFTFTDLGKSHREYTATAKA